MKGEEYKSEDFLKENYKNMKAIADLFAEKDKSLLEVYSCME